LRHRKSGFLIEAFKASKGKWLFGQNGQRQTKIHSGLYTQSPLPR
jgi:hypothetical protein